MWLEELAVGPASQTVDAVRADNQIGALELGEIPDLSLELEPDSKRTAAPLEDVEQHLARDAGKDMAPRADLRLPVEDVDRVPSREALADLGVGLVVGVPQRAQRLLRKDDAPPEGRVGWIALHDQDLVTRIGLLRQQREVQSRRSAAEDGVSHRFSPLPRPAGRSARCPRPWGTTPAHRNRRLRSHG